MTFRVLSTFVFSLLLGLQLPARDLTLGLELEFQGQGTQFEFYPVPGGPIQRAKRAVVEFIRASCSGCEIRKIEGYYFFVDDFLITTPGGAKFEISSDPFVIEVKSYGTLEQWSVWELDLQTYVFDAFASIGLRPRSKNYATHINLGFLSAFENDPETFLRFLLEFANDPELGLGVLGADELNAPPVSHLKSKSWERLGSIVDDFNRGRQSDVVKLAQRIVSEVYTNTPFVLALNDKDHYQAIGLKYAASKRALSGKDFPVDLRFTYSQESAREVLLWGLFFRSQIEYLRSQRGQSLILSPRRRARSLTVDERAERFRKYALKIGVRPMDYVSILPTEVGSALARLEIGAGRCWAFAIGENL